jgi:hypothetical protein
MSDEISILLKSDQQINENNNNDLSSYREIKLSKEFQNQHSLKNKILQLSASNRNTVNQKVPNKISMSRTKRNAKREVVDDQLEDFEDIDLSKDDYIQMVLHYKSLCKVKQIL